MVVKQLLFFLLCFPLYACELPVALSTYAVAVGVCSHVHRKQIEAQSNAQKIQDEKKRVGKLEQDFVKRVLDAGYLSDFYQKCIDYCCKASENNRIDWKRDIQQSYIKKKFSFFWLSNIRRDDLYTSLLDVSGKTDFTSIFTQMHNDFVQSFRVQNNTDVNVQSTHLLDQSMCRITNYLLCVPGKFIIDRSAQGATSLNDVLRRVREAVDNNEQEEPEVPWGFVIPQSDQEQVFPVTLPLPEDVQKVLNLFKATDAKLYAGNNGTYYDRKNDRIVIDFYDYDDPKQVLSGLGHELVHRQFHKPIGTFILPVSVYGLTIFLFYRNNLSVFYDIGVGIAESRKSGFWIKLLLSGTTGFICEMLYKKILYYHREYHADLLSALMMGNYEHKKSFFDKPDAPGLGFSWENISAFFIPSHPPASKRFQALEKLQETGRLPWYYRWM